jgi:N-acetyl-anhydromuramyl-L-alanine amidase AmpD
MVVFWMDKYGIPLERVVCHKDIDGYGRRTDPRDWDHGKFLRFVMREETRDKYLSRIKEIIEEWQR